MEVGKVVHSQSQPGGIDRTPPGTPKKAGKMLAVRVQMLDDTITMFQVQAKALGRVLFDQVCSQLHLLESDYFGLEYQEMGGTKYWLDLEKPLSRQIGLSLVDPLVWFCVKFYTPDPSQLEEEFTRYLFCLQIKRDLSQGLLQCNSNTAALMASYIVQAECGDYVAEDYPDHRYLSSYKFVPNQDQELEKRIMENHKKHAGQSPAEADLNLLETARRCELYGIKMHPAKDHEGVPLNLAVAHMGIVVFQNFTKINTFSWAKIRKISFKRKRFLVKLHPEGYGYYKDTVEFFFEGRNECKNFWKKCVENHGFFRCSIVKKVPRQKTRVLSRGSSFRYSGRTQKQIVDFVRENYVKRQAFQRSQSFRHSSSAHSSVANVGTSISAHPLLPLGENAVAGTPASLSCGSMTLTSSPLHVASTQVGELPSPPLVTSGSPGTSVTSSPQHFYPRETPYLQTGHQSAKVKRPHEHSHRGISSLQSPTNAATGVNNHSANLSNNDDDDEDNFNYNDFMGSDAKSLKGLDYANYNDVYSNCYSSLRSLQNHAVDSEDNYKRTKTDICDGTGHFLNGTSKSNESIKTSKSPTCKKPRREEGFAWNRSASYKDLYHEKNPIKDDESIEKVKATSKTCRDDESNDETREFEFDSLVNPRNRNGSKSHSIAVSGSNPSGSRKNDFLKNDVKMLSGYSSYPGTTSSLSTESVADEKAEMGANEGLVFRSDSQEELALSHDDVSHDSYELLEREPTDFDDEAMANSKGRRMAGGSDRARSCSWGSNRGASPLHFKSSENVEVVAGKSAGLAPSRENEFRSLERQKSPKNKSATDFRSLERKCPNEGRKSTGKKGREKDPDRTREAVDDDDDELGKEKENREDEDDFLNGVASADRIEAGMEYLGFFDREPWVRRPRKTLEEEGCSGIVERSKHQARRKSLEKSESFPAKREPDEKPIKERQYRVEERKRMERKRDKKERFHEGTREKEQMEWERENERRQLERFKDAEVEGGVSVSGRKFLQGANDFSDFKEIHLKKFDRVVSNQFGKYSEFLTEENNYDLLVDERKVMENYEKVCQVGKLAREMEKKERSCLTGSKCKNDFSKNGIQANGNELKNEEATKEFAKSAHCSLFHQGKEKTVKGEVDLTAASKSTSTTFSKAAVTRTESDPFSDRENPKRNVVLANRKSLGNEEVAASDQDGESGSSWWKKSSRSELDIPYILHKRHYNGNGGPRRKGDVAGEKLECDEIKNPSRSECESLERSSPEEKSLPQELLKNSTKSFVENEATGNETVNFEKALAERVANLKVHSKPPVGKKPTPAGANKMDPERVCEKSEDLQFTGIQKTEESIKKAAEFILDSVGNGREIDEGTGKIPTESPRGANLSCARQKTEEIYFGGDKKANVNGRVPDSAALESEGKTSPEQETFIRKPKACVLPKKSLESFEFKITADSNEESAEESGKSQPPLLVRGMQGVIGSVRRRRQESLILFARTRLGLSEGSAFAPFPLKRLPASQRRTKSLDAPYVSLHRLPPADAFSSKDDTVDSNEGDAVTTADAFRKELKLVTSDRSDRRARANSVLEMRLNLEKKEDVHFAGHPKTESEMRKKWTDGSRCRKVSSKMERVEGLDSEGDADGSKLTDRSLAIPSDRLVNLPESVRFPSVRQISGQTSEESADGWEQKEVKVKRRTPRRSVGRDEPEPGATEESVVWDSKDEELPEVWDDGLVFGRKRDGSNAIDGPVPADYLKRGSCGQSIDDDNLSTPMKETSPEHWVSVDDLPEALEREGILLRKQERLLREKILSEKLKRELNLDAIIREADRKCCDCRGGFSLAEPEDLRLQSELVDAKGKFKGRSLDAHEPFEKRLREKRENNYCSLDEHLLREKCFKSEAFAGDEGGEGPPRECLVTFSRRRNVDYLGCKIVSDPWEIDRFVVDNDEEVEEFFVVLDGKAENGREIESFLESADIFQDEEGRGSLSKEDSVISVPEEFRDDKEGGAEFWSEEEFRSDEAEVEMNGSAGNRGERDSECDSKERRDFFSLNEMVFEATGNGGKLISSTLSDGLPSNFERDAVGTASPCEDPRHLPPADDGGRLSPCETSPGRNSCHPMRLSASEEPDRLSPFNDSRRPSEESRRLSSEDSRKCSISESVSEETRRRLSSTEETRRKRASMTKQCSVGGDSLSDEIISGIRECSSSFEQDDEKDVFEAEPARPVESSTASPTPNGMENLAREKVAKGNEEIERVLESKMKSNANGFQSSDRNPYAIRKSTNFEISPMPEAEEGSNRCADVEGVGKSIGYEIDLSESEAMAPWKSESLGFFSKDNFDSPKSKSDESGPGSFDEIATEVGTEKRIVEVGDAIEATESISVGDLVLDGKTTEKMTCHLFGLTSGRQNRSAENQHKMLSKITSQANVAPLFFASDRKKLDSSNNSKSSLDSSQESDVDRLEEFFAISHVHNQIARRNLSEAGKSLRCEEFKLKQAVGRGIGRNKFSSEELERTESSSSSSFEGKQPIYEEVARFQSEMRGTSQGRKIGLKPLSEKEKGEMGAAAGREKESLDREKRDSGEDGSSSSSAPLRRKRELSSTWKPFLLESSGSSSLEENWLPPDDNAHLADEEETTSTSNNRQDESGPDEFECPATSGYPTLSISSAEMMVGGYGGVYSLARTLSRISERSTSEQERSDLEDESTKASSHSVSMDEESVLSSDRQPSLSSDTPSLKGSAARIPDLPDDRCFTSESAAKPEKAIACCEPFGGVIPPPLQDDDYDWPSPASNSIIYDEPGGVSHVETVYLEIYPEEACKVIVAEPQNDEGRSSSDENRTQNPEEGEFLHLSSDNASASAATTQDATVVVPSRRRSARTASVSEDTSLTSISDRSSSTGAKPKTNSNSGISEEFSEPTKTSSNLAKSSARMIRRGPANEESSSDLTSSRPGTEEAVARRHEVLECHRGTEPVSSPSKRDAKIMGKVKPPRLTSSTGRTVVGFSEEPASKVRSPQTCQSAGFFEAEGDREGPSPKSPPSRSESWSSKDCKRFPRSPVRRETCTFFQVRDVPASGKGSDDEEGRLTARIPRYPNVADRAENSFFGRCNFAGSRERERTIDCRKSSSHHSVSKTSRDEDEEEGEKDISDGESSRAAGSNTIPRASRRTKKRHRVAMDLEIRDGRIVSLPKPRATVIADSDGKANEGLAASGRGTSDGPEATSSGLVTREESEREISKSSLDITDNCNVLSSTPLQNGKANGEISSGDSRSPKSPDATPLKCLSSNGPPTSERNAINLDYSFSPTCQNRNDLKGSPKDSSCLGQNSCEGDRIKSDANESIGGSNQIEVEGGGAELEVKKKRYNADKGYFMMKELLATERTYKKNLDVINKWFHDEVSKSEDEMPEDVLNGLFNLFDPLNAGHTQFLRDLEQRMATWEGKSSILNKREIQKVGDIILVHFNILPLYVKYLDKHLLVLERLDAAFRKNKKFEQVYRDFELQRICYLPLSSFIMTPLQKLLHYRSLLERMVKHYGPDHLDYKDFSLALKKLEPIVQNVPDALRVSENFVQLSELQRDMPSFEGLVQGGREFIRQGCLLKHSKKGFQQRMFFLFKVNGQMPLRGVMIEDSDDRIGTDFTFTIYGGNRTLVVAASSQDEKEKWLKDLYEAVQNAKERNDGKTLQYLSLKSCSSSDEVMDKIGEDGTANRSKNPQQRSNTTVHVCWHRNTSTSLRDHLRAFENELSGFLLRKFKNSNGWQKLWVVFANFCLFFYKAHSDESPLASLPLLGYTVTVPDEEDDIRKDYVFKLQFKNHVYFFRAESDYTFSRWMEIISSATRKNHVE